MEYSNIKKEEFIINKIIFIPDGLDSESNISRYFTYFYEQFAISYSYLFKIHNFEYADFTSPMETFLNEEYREHQKYYGKTDSSKKEWIIYHYFIFKRLANMFNLVYLEKTVDNLIKKIDKIDLDSALFYVDYLNMALYAQTSISMSPRPIEYIKRNKVESSFNSEMSQILFMYPMIHKTLKKHVKVSEMKDLSDYIDKRFTKYIRPHEVLSEYLIGIIAVKRNIILFKPDDTDEIIENKIKSAELEIRKFIDLTCNINDSMKQGLVIKLTDIILNS